MLTLDTPLHLPAHVSFSVVGEDAFLLNTRTSKYYLLQEVGARLWTLLSQESSLRAAYETLLGEYDVAPDELERDLLELVADLAENDLLEYIQA
jgi:hypothetical protein